MRVSAERELLAPRDDVWALIAEPRHLADWWPAYEDVRPDRRGLALGARWQITRGRTPGFLRRPGGEGMLVITAVEPGQALAWQDVQQGFEARIDLEAALERTRARLTLDAPWWRLDVEGLRRVPREALARLHGLCQTAATLS